MRVSGLVKPVCVANEEHKFLVEATLADYYKTSDYSNSIILEPTGRNTAAAMAIAALKSDIRAFDLLLFFQ